ncbi:CoA binding domain-containing protein [Lasiosphaeria miniovina]|uniref:CoA binding domain-containing protein n=1 Tax=Lasiosphaeria miniovina TaxID=1954250 RepID=A0AA39ZR39_9PEZI|nr:CoA binding domain-containing protein [Lasiosphaeria miniovina]KAK0702071.1 CoA binding domain-containing protein [Lasiosphaeria miniovina]
MSVLRHLLPRPARSTSLFVTAPLLQPRALVQIPPRPQEHHHHLDLLARPSSTATMATTDATLRTFFQSPKFAVVGASTNPDKFGYKVFKWYVTRNLDVTPVNPGATAIKIGDEELPTVGSLSDIADPADTSVSFITPPPVTLKTLKLAKELGFPAVFLQPGTFDDEVLEFARDNFEAAVAGDGGWGSEGWCVLVDGDRGLKAVGKL